MSLTKIGLSLPATIQGLKLYGDSAEDYSYIYIESSGMEYELWKDSDDRLFLKSWHESVGQEVWYEITMSVWENLKTLELEQD